MLPILCLVLLTPAVFTLELEAQVLEDFRSGCEETIFKHLQDEYITLLPMMVKQNESIRECKGKMWEQSECRTCLESSCPTHDFGSYPYGERTPLFDWAAWKRVGYTLFGENLDLFLSRLGQFKAHFGLDLDQEVPEDKSEYLEARRVRRPSSGGRPSGRPGEAIDGMLDNFETGMDLLNTIDFDGFLNGFGDLFNGIGDVLGDITDGIGDVVGDIGSGIGDFFGGIFGRRALWKSKMDMAPEALECMLQCAVCGKWNAGLKEESINYGTSVCGPKVVENALYMKRFMTKFSTFLAMNEEHRGVITKIEYNRDNFELSTLSYGDVYITAMFPSGPMRYLSKYRLRLQSPETTVVEISEELCSKWGV